MNKQYSAEFKLEAVKRIERTGESVTKVVSELGIKPTIKQVWVKKYKQSFNAPFHGSGNRSQKDEKLRKLERENRELREESEILKNQLIFIKHKFIVNGNIKIPTYGIEKSPPIFKNIILCS